MKSIEVKQPMLTPAEQFAKMKSMYRFDVKVHLKDGKELKRNTTPLNEAQAISLIRALITCGVDEVQNDLSVRFWPPGQIAYIDMVRAYDPEIDAL